MRYRAIWMIRWWLTPFIVGPVLALGGWRFDKTWRHAEHGPKAWVYAYVLCTFRANWVADDLVIVRSGEDRS
jgi:hypothetical protein